MRPIDADTLKRAHGMGGDCAECDKETRRKSTACEYDRAYTLMDFCGWIDDAPTVSLEPEWIPFKTRALTDEEREEHPEWDCIIVGPMPDDGQKILVSINLKGHEEVQSDEFYTDDGCYLDSGYEIEREAVAWMPLPEPYKEGEQE